MAAPVPWRQHPLRPVGAAQSYRSGNSASILRVLSIMDEPILLSLLCALAFAAVHVVTPHLTFISAVPRSRWLSFAGGVAVAYVFMHLLPELAEHERAFGETNPELRQAVYAVSLAGLTAFYGLERMVQKGRARKRHEGSADRAPDGTFWLHIVSFSFYNLLIGYLLLHREESGVVPLLLYFAAMALHFFTSDFGLHQDHARLYQKRARWLLSIAVLAGWALGMTGTVPAAVVTTLFAFLAGGVVLNVLKEELPEERRSRFVPFLIGVAGYGALLAIA